MRLHASIAAALASSLLVGCAPTYRAGWETAVNLMSIGREHTLTPPHPDYRYLSVSVNGHPALLALAAVEMGNDQRPVEVWMGSGREVLRLREGRLVALEGTTVEWRRVQFTKGTPDWPQDGRPVRYERERDQMPEYHIGLREQLELREIAAPSRHAMRHQDAASVRWFEESVLEPTRNTAPPSPARYAVTRDAQPKVVYAEQCLSPDLCLTWEPLPWTARTPT